MEVLHTVGLYKAIFRVRTLSRITYQSGDEDYLMNETRRRPTTGTRYTRNDVK